MMVPNAAGSFEGTFSNTVPGFGSPESFGSGYLGNSGFNYMLMPTDDAWAEFNPTNNS